MSNPISNVTSIPSAAKPSAGATKQATTHPTTQSTTDAVPELEIDGPIDPASPPPLLEVDSDDDAYADSAKGASSGEAAASPKKRRRGMGFLSLVLGLLLAGSVAFNVKQANDLATLSNTNDEFEMALTAAVDRIDVETIRAESAEATLGGIDGAVDTVNERVESLLEALTALSAATKN